jgi:hypothetical protein
MSDLIPFDFHGDRLMLVDENGEPRIVLRPAMDALGLDYSTQYTKLKSRSWARVGLCPTTGADGKTYQMVTVDVRTFLMLLATIDERRVAKDVAPKLVMYQAEVADAIEAYWTQGGAINPRASDDQLERLAKTAAVLQNLRGLADPGFLDAKARIIAAQAMGETPMLDQETKPLTVSIYLAEKKLRKATVKSISGQFGKYLKALFIARYGEAPFQVDAIVDHHAIKVAQYQEKHRPMFDQVWFEHYLSIEGGAAS